MAATFHVLPVQSPLKFLLLRKCIPVLEKLKVFGAEQFVHDCIDAVTVDSFHFSRYEGVSEAELNPVVEAYKLFVKQVVNLNLTKEQVLEDLKSLRVTEETAKLVWTALFARFSELRHTLQIQHAEMTQNYLSDFDWKLHLSLASDKISKLRHPVLLLQLSLYQNEKSKSCSVTLELTKEELDQLIATLDVVNTELQKLKA